MVCWVDKVGHGDTISTEDLGIIAKDLLNTANGRNISVLYKYVYVPQPILILREAIPLFLVSSPGRPIPSFSMLPAETLKKL